METRSSATTLLEPDSPPVRRVLSRSAVYGLLAIACTYPTEARLRTLMEEAYPEALEGGADLTRAVRTAIEALRQALGELGLDSLRSRHHAVFGHMPLPDCPAYETGYLGSSVFRQTQAMADISGYYRAFGLRPSEAERERVDHLTVELEFMRFLTFKEAVALVHHSRASARVCRRAQRRFWRDHLGRWLPVFSGLFADRAPDGFFGGVAALLGEFARAESAALGRPQPATGLTSDRASFSEMECALANGVCLVPEGQSDGSP